MRILIVDDDGRKRDRISEVVKEAVGREVAAVDAVGSSSEAARSLESVQYDLMVFDLNLPVKEGDRPKRDGGVRLLKQLLKGGPRFRRPVHILGLTGYEDLMNSFGREFTTEAWQLVRYDETCTDWADTLQNKVRHIAESARSIKAEQFDYDLAIITALKDIEFEAVLALDAGWTQVDHGGDSTIYYEGTFRNGNVTRRVVAAAAYEMGMAASACLATKMAITFRPRYLAMAGIAAGIGMNFGDILIADQSWDYGSGKLRGDPYDPKSSIFAPAPNYIRIDSRLKEAIEHFITRRKDLIAAIQVRWPGNPVESVLKARVGPVASGAAVLESGSTIEEIRKHNRKLVGVEMETYGMYLAASVAPAPRPGFFSAKSVCDFGVPPKTDEYQKYAAFTSANFIREFYMHNLAE